MSETQIQPRKGSEIISENINGKYSAHEIKIMISNSIIPAIAINRPNDIEVFLRFCIETGANPLLKQAHMIPQKYKDHNGITQQGFISVADYHFKMAKAATSGQWGGFSKVTYNGGMTIKECKDEGITKPETAEVTVYKIINSVRIPVAEIEVHWAEYGRNTPIWNAKPFFMLGKVAKSHATSDGFPAEVGNLTTVDEVGEYAINQDADSSLERLSEALQEVANTENVNQLERVENEWVSLFGNNAEFTSACNDRYNEFQAEG